MLSLIRKKEEDPRVKAKEREKVKSQAVHRGQEVLQGLEVLLELKTKSSSILPFGVSLRLARKNRRSADSLPKAHAIKEKIAIFTTLSPVSIISRGSALKVQSAKMHIMAEEEVIHL